MPEELWRSAAQLAGSEGVWAVTRALGLNYGNLKRRVVGRPEQRQRAVEAQPLFVEVGRAGAVVVPGCVLEIQDREGLRMTVRLEGQSAADVVGLGSALWRACR